MSTPETTTLAGGCHCGALRYTVEGAPQFSFLCHCDNCRQLNGGCRLAGASVGADGFTMTGEPTSYRYQGGNASIELRFCGVCGTTVCAVPSEYPGVVVVRANTLDDQAAFTPMKSIYGDQACAWDTLVGG